MGVELAGEGCRMRSRQRIGGCFMAVSFLVALALFAGCGAGSNTPDTVPTALFEGDGKAVPTVGTPVSEPVPTVGTPVSEPVPDPSDPILLGCEAAVVAAIFADGSWLSPDGGAFDEWSGWDDEFEEWLALPAQEAAVQEAGDLVARRDDALFALFGALSEMYGEADAGLPAGASMTARALYAAADKARADAALAERMGYGLWPGGGGAASLHEQLADEIDTACLRAGR